MGEKISTLGHVIVSEVEYEVELNHPPSAGLPRQIHIQSERFRIELDEIEFIQTALAFNLAAEKLRRLKKMK
jgi:hypothetical protein